MEVRTSDILSRASGHIRQFLRFLRNFFNFLFLIFAIFLRNGRVDPRFIRDDQTFDVFADMIQKDLMFLAEIFALLWLNLSLLSINNSNFSSSNFSVPSFSLIALTSLASSDACIVIGSMCFLNSENMTSHSSIHLPMSFLSALRASFPCTLRFRQQSPSCFS